jgi:hypothetical protein
MTRTLAIAAAFAVACVAAVAVAETRPIAFDVQCESPEKERQYEECAADCKKSLTRGQKGCNATYRRCRGGCADAADRRVCRARCREGYRECSKSQRDKLKECRADCLKASGCREIPEPPG